MDIELIIHVHFKWVENQHHFSYFSISHKTHQQISHWTITALRISHDDYQLSMKTNITHDDDQLSTKPPSTKTTRDHEDDVIMETERDFEEDCEEEESLFEDIVCYFLYLIVGVL